MASLSNIQNFNNLFNEYQERFIRFAMSYVRDKQIAEDFVSEAFVAYWERIHQFSENDNLPAYILTMVKNKCLNHLQHLQTRYRVEKEINDHEVWLLNLNINTLQACDPDFIFSEEIQQIIDETLKKLPSKTRKIFVLNRFNYLSYKEIAEKMNLSQKTIEFHISKALSHLRLALKDFIVAIVFFIYFY